MTVVESGTESGFEYTPGEARSVAIHEAGHAVAAHIYRTNVESSRLSIKRRGQTGGHHQSFEKEDRFIHFQSELFADIIHGLGAMAAEIVFYGENTEGVGGDLQSATWDASHMVGGSGMAPQIIDLKDAKFADETDAETQARIRKRFEDIGLRLMNRFNTTEALRDGRKRAYAAQFIGEAFVTAYNAMLVNKEAVSRIADAVIEKQEIFGDDLISLLDNQHLIKPDIAWTDEASWPKVVWTGKYDTPVTGIRDRDRDERRDEQPEATRHDRRAEQLSAAAPGSLRRRSGRPPAGVRRWSLRRRRRFERRFMLVYTVLGLILVGASAGLIIYASQPGPPSAKAWSVWQPAPGTAKKMTQEIADHVSSEYRLSAGGGQLVTVVPSVPTVTSGTEKIAIKAIAIRKTATSNNGIQVLDSSKSEMYTLCGLGAGCSIASGTPTQTRGRLVRREALEVALYTFKFVPSVKSVIAFMPPPPGQNPTSVLFLQKGNMTQALDLPLHTTLPLSTPPLPTETDDAESTTIDSLTPTFDYSLTALPQGGAALVLDPPST